MLDLHLDMPLARIRKLIDLPPGAAAVELAAYRNEWEQGLAAKRELVGFLIDQLTGKETAMYEVSVRDIPARALLSVREQLNTEEIGEFATPLFALFGGPTIPRPAGIAGLPFLRYHGESSRDGDAPVEFCCPVNDADIDEVTAPGFESLHRWLVDSGEQSDWLPRQIFLLDPTTADATDTVYELAVRLR